MRKAWTSFILGQGHHTERTSAIFSGLPKLRNAIKLWGKFHILLRFIAASGMFQLLDNYGGFCL